MSKRTREREREIERHDAKVEAELRAMSLDELYRLSDFLMPELFTEDRDQDSMIEDIIYEKQQEADSEAEAIEIASREAS